MVDIGTLSGSPYSYVLGVNAIDQVVGFSEVYPNSSIVEHAFSWTQASGMVDLGTLGGSKSRATAVNDTGQVVAPVTLLAVKVMPSYGRRKAG